MLERVLVKKTMRGVVSSRFVRVFPLRAVAAEVRDTLLQLFFQEEREEAAGHVTARCDASQNVQLAAARGRGRNVRAYVRFASVRYYWAP